MTINNFWDFNSDYDDTYIALRLIQLKYILLQ